MTLLVGETWREASTLVDEQDELHASEQFTPKSIGTAFEEGLGGVTRYGAEGPTHGEAKPIGSVPIVATTTADMDDKRPRTAQAVSTSVSIKRGNDSMLVKEDRDGEASDSNTDGGEGGTSATNKKVSERRRAQNAKFKSWWGSV